MTGSLMARPRVPRIFGRLGEEMEQVMEGLFGPEPEWAPTRWVRRAWRPSVDVAETEKAFEVTVELPGFTPEEFTVEVLEGNLWIRGEHAEEAKENGKTYHRIERRSGRFERMIPLPTAIDVEHVTAEFHNGVLSITLPKTPEARPRPITVKTT